METIEGSDPYRQIEAELIVRFDVKDYSKVMKVFERAQNELSEYCLSAVTMEELNY